jgi:chorismate mutase
MFKGGPEIIDFNETLEKVNEKIDQLDEKLSENNSMRTNIQYQVSRLKQEGKSIPLLGKRESKNEPRKTSALA